MSEDNNPVAKLIGPVRNMIQPTAEKIYDQSLEAVWKGLKDTPFGMFMDDVPPRKKGA